MAGIRTSAVINVGVATLCALIGAGGLGELIFRGIAMVNSKMILAGALPAAVLALVFDGGLGLIEKGLIERKRNSLRLIAGLALSGTLILIAFFPSGFGKKAERQITIGSKEFTEQIVLSEILAQLVETRTDVSVVRKFGLGGTMVCFSALKSGEIDLYPEYTGTGLTAILNREVVTDPDQVYRIVSETFEETLDLIWLQPFGFNNTYALAMRNDHAEKLNLKTVSDLSKRGSDLVAGFTQEFLERPDGYPGLTKHYHLRFTSEPKGMDPGLMYVALRGGDVDIICAFATDGRIPAFNLRVLEDDKQYFPPYYAAPVVRKESLARVPELGSILNELSGLIDDQKMAEMIASALNLSINEVKCKGCRAEDGQCANLAMECRVYRCTKNTGAKTCAECDDFPCEYLHPYSDQVMKPHNTKVYSLCRIRKVGLEKWAKDEAGSILDKYYYGTWTL